MANHFYRERVDQHLRIGIRAIELLQEHGCGPLPTPLMVNTLRHDGRAERVTA